MSTLMNELVDAGVVHSTYPGVVEISALSEEWILVKQDGFWIGKLLNNGSTGWLSFARDVDLESIVESIVGNAS